MADVEAAIQEMFQAPHIQVSLKFSLYVNIELWLNCYWHLYSICLNDNMLEEDIKLINEACNILIVMSCYKANYMWINRLSKQYYAERKTIEITEFYLGSCLFCSETVKHDVT